MWGEPWTAHSVFRRWKRSRALSRRCHRSLATCQAMHGDAVKARSGREMTKWLCRPGFSQARPSRPRGIDSSHWLFSQCFRAPSPNTAERSQSINGHESRKRNFGRQSSISCQAMHGDAVKARPGREMTKWRCRPGFSEARPFRPSGFDFSQWLLSQRFHAPSPNIAERSQSINVHRSRKRNCGCQSSISCV